MRPTDQLVPAGTIPAKEEYEKYKELYASSEDYSLISGIHSLDTASLPEQTVRMFCKTHSIWTGVGSDGELDESLQERYSVLCVSLQLDEQELRLRESFFRRDSSPAQFGYLRAACVRMVKTKVSRDYVKAQVDLLTPEELSEETERCRRLREKKEKEREEEEARMDRYYEILENDLYLRNLYYYDLTEEEMDELLDLQEKILSDTGPDYGRVRRYEFRRGYYDIPILCLKVKILRKALKMD